MSKTPGPSQLSELTKKALSAPTAQIPGFSSYLSLPKHEFIGHSSRFQNKTISQILVNQKSLCQYCYHTHKLSRNYMTTVCNCGKTHQKCLAHYIRRNWSQIKKSQRFPFFYKMKCKKCQKFIYFRDHCRQNLTNLRFFSKQEVIIFLSALAIEIISLLLVVLFIYLAAVNEESGIKAIFSILVILFVLIFVFTLNRITWKLFHTRFYRSSVQKNQFSATRGLDAKSATSKNFQPNINSSASLKKPTEMDRKSSAIKYHRYNRRKLRMERQNSCSENIEQNKIKSAKETVEVKKLVF